MTSIPTTLGAIVRRHQVATFYVLAYALTWLVWGTSVSLGSCGVR